MSDKRPNHVKLSDRAQAGAQCEFMAELIAAGRLVIPDEGVPMMLCGLRLLVTKDQTPLKEWE